MGSINVSAAPWITSVGASTRRGPAEPAQAVGSGAGRPDGEELATGAVRCEGAVVGGGGVGPPAVLVGVLSGAPVHLHAGDVALDGGVAIGRRGAGQQGVGLGARRHVLR